MKDWGLAEFIVAVAALGWLVSVVAAVFNPELAPLVQSLNPVMGTLVAGAIGVLFVVRKRGDNGKNGD